MFRACGAKSGSVFATVFVDYYVVAGKIGVCGQTRAVDPCGQSQDSAAQAGGCPAARHTDRHVRTGGVGQPEAPATASNAHRMRA